MKARRGKKKQNRKQDNRLNILPGGRAWLAVGTIAAYAAAGAGSKSSLLWAAPHWGRHQPMQAQLTVRRFDIPAGPLDIALGQLAKECDLAVEFTVPKDTIPGFKSQGAIGLYSQEQVLKLILAGTGLDFSFPDLNTVSIGVRNSQSVLVNATVSDSFALGKLPTPLIDTPQSITAIPSYILADQGVSTLRDTLRNAPGISLAAGEGGAQGDNLTIRGFGAQNDIFLDGMRDFGNYYRDPFNYSQVDVLEGPAGVEFGRGSTGGVINQQSKQPELHPFITVDAEGGTDTTRRLTADINEPLPDFAGGAAFRLNVMGHDAGISERDVVNSRRYGVAPTFAFGLNTPARVTAGYFHFAEDDIPDYGLPWYFGHPAPVPRHNYYGFAERNFLRTDVDMGTVKVEHSLGSHGLLRDSIRYAQYQRKWQITEPQLNNASAGAITPQTPLDQVMVNR
ncbi:MAG: TonB-dependent receptor, partial [Acidobacteriaceae bacterium]